MKVIAVIVGVISIALLLWFGRAAFLWHECRETSPIKVAILWGPPTLELCERTISYHQRQDCTFDLNTGQTNC